MASKITSTMIAQMMNGSLPDVRGIKIDAMYRDVPPPPPTPVVPPGRDAMAIIAEWFSGAPRSLLAEVEHIAAGLDRLEELRVEWSRRPGVGGVTYREGSSAALNVYGDDGRHWCVIRVALVRIVDSADDAAVLVDTFGYADEHGN